MARHQRRVGARQEVAVLVLYQLDAGGEVSTAKAQYRMAVFVGRLVL
jgi:hypothetical protein